MTNQEILKYISDHYPIGRWKLIKQLGIPEAKAREMLAMYHSQADIKNIDLKRESPQKMVEKYLSEKGVSWEQVQEMLNQRQYPVVNIPTYDKRSFTFAIMSDLHYCDKACAVDEITDFYRRCDESGVEFVLNSGDIVSGNGVYKGQHNDLSVFGFKDQLDYVSEIMPKLANGGKTYCISGNHDLSFKQENGAHMLSSLAERRADIIDCGDYDAKITVNGINIGLHHGGGGNAYALSYKLQKAIELIGADQKPQIYVLGHYHTALYSFIRNIHCFMPGCFQKPNDLSVRFNLPNTIGGWIVELEIENDGMNTIREITTKYVAYYR